MKWLIKRLLLIGKIPLCNGIASRAPHIFGFCFPLCYRCTFVLLSFFITFVLIYKKEKINIKNIYLILLLPLIIDGSLQTFCSIESNNLRRSITGILFGIALAILIKKLFIKIDERTVL